MNDVASIVKAIQGAGEAIAYAIIIAAILRAVFNK